MKNNPTKPNKNKMRPSPRFDGLLTLKEAESNRIDRLNQDISSKVENFYKENGQDINYLKSECENDYLRNNVGVFLKSFISYHFSAKEKEIPSLYLLGEEEEGCKWPNQEVFNKINFIVKKLCEEYTFNINAKDWMLENIPEGIFDDLNEVVIKSFDGYISRGFGVHHDNKFQEIEFRFKLGRLENVSIKGGEYKFPDRDDESFAEELHSAFEYKKCDQKLSSTSNHSSDSTHFIFRSSSFSSNSSTGSSKKNENKKVEREESKKVSSDNTQEEEVARKSKVSSDIRPRDLWWPRIQGPSTTTQLNNDQQNTNNPPVNAQPLNNNSNNNNQGNTL